MLVVFSTKAHESVTMFGDVAIRLLHIMGHSGTVPSAMMVSELPEALAALQKAVHVQTPSAYAADGEEEEDAVSLKQRAYPLMKLLEHAIEEDSSVIWSAQ